MVILKLIFNMLILMPNILMTLMVVLHTWVVLQRQNCVLRCFLPRFVAKHREPYNTYKGDNHESVDTHHYTTKITSRSNSPGFPCTKRRACCRLPGLKTTRLRKSNSSRRKNINTNLRKKINIFHGLTLKQSLPMSLVACDPERAFRRSRVPHSYWWWVSEKERLFF